VVEPTHLNNISHNGNLPQIGVKLKIKKIETTTQTIMGFVTTDVTTKRGVLSFVINPIVLFVGWFVYDRCGMLWDLLHSMERKHMSK